MLIQVKLCKDNKNCISWDYCVFLRLDFEEIIEEMNKKNRINLLIFSLLFCVLGSSVLRAEEDRHDMVFQMRGSMMHTMRPGEAPATRYKMNNFRWNVEGQVTDRLFYQFRQSFNANFRSNMYDGLLESIDYAYLRWQAFDRFSLTMGKQVFAFGGEECWAAPVYVLQYSDFGGSLACYQLGVTGTFQLADRHELLLQVANLRGVEDGEYFYGGLPDGTHPTQAPLLYTVNWNGSFLENSRLDFRYSASWGQQAIDRHIYFLTMGQSFRRKDWGVYLDFTYSRQDLDANGLISRSAVFADGKTRTVENVEYYSMVGYFHWNFDPSWAFFLKGVREYGALYKSFENVPAGFCRADWNAQVCLEYMPTQSKDFRFFVHYNYYKLDSIGVGHQLQLPQDEEHRLSLGLIYIMPVF